jgi:uncharacterized repeat protein (TIGR02543 family)
MKKTVYGFIIMAVLAMVFAACDTSSLSGIVNGPPVDNTGQTVTVTLNLGGTAYTLTVPKGTVIDDAYINAHKGELEGLNQPFALDGLALGLGGQAVTANGDISVPSVWKLNGVAVETWHTVTFTVNGETYPVLVPEGASLTADKQAELEAFLEVPAGSLAEVTWADLSNISEDKTPEAIMVTTYAVTFDLDYETENKTSIQQVVSGESVITLPVPSERAEHSFGGWFTAKNGGGTEFTGTTAVTGAVTVYAKWTENGPPPPIEFYNADYSSGTAFVTDDWTGAGAVDEAWTLTAGEYGTVFFAVNKAEGQTVTVSGVDVELVTVYESGSVEGAVVDDDGALAALLADGTRTVVAVNTRDLLFEGGTRTFALEEGERSIPVTVEVSPNLTGAAVFLVEHVDGREFLTRKDTGTESISYMTLNGGQYGNTTTGPANPAPFSGSVAMMDALAWVDYNTAGDQEWLIRVENAENLIPRTLLGSGMNAANIKIRLRGHDGTAHIIKHDGSNAIYTQSHPSDDSFYGKNLYSSLSIAFGFTHGAFSPTGGVANGMINVCGKAGDNGETVPYLTLQLERGITLKGLVDKDTEVSTSKTFHYGNMVGLAGNAGLVMKAGSKITGYYLSINSNNMGLYSIIRRHKTHDVSPNLQAVSIEAGAEISGNRMKSFGSVVSGDKPVIIYLVKPQKIFISKNAIIQDNVQSGSDDVNFAHVGSQYSIKSDGNGEQDIILPPSAD